MQLYILFYILINTLVLLQAKPSTLVKQSKYAQLRIREDNDDGGGDNDDAGGGDDDGGDDAGGDDAGGDDAGGDDAGGDDAGGDDDGGGGGGGGLGGGNFKDMENEENLRKAAHFHFKKIDEFMIVQNQKILDAIYGDALEFNDSMNETVDKINDGISKWAFRIDWNFTHLNQDLQEERFSTSKVTLIVIDNEIRKKEKQLKRVLGSYYRLKNELPEEGEMCGSYFTCKECLQDEHCGWCPLDQKCVIGDEDSPSFTSCQHYNYQFCQGVECLKYEQCNTCLSDPDCGWCQVDEDNIKVCLQQPHDFKGCPNWYHIESSSFRCPRKTKLMKEEEDIEEADFWIRPKKKQKVCKVIKPEMEKKIEKQRKEYNDKNSENHDQNKLIDVKQKQFEGIERQIRNLRSQLNSLQNRKEQLEQFIEEYKEQNLISEEEVEELAEEQEDQKKEEQNDQKKDQKDDEAKNDDSTTSEKQAPIIYRKKKEKSKAEELDIQEENIEPQEEQQIEQEEELNDLQQPEEDEDDEINFEMAKDYTVDIGHHLKSKPKSKPKSKQKAEKHASYSKDSDREIEGTIDMDNDDWLFDQNYQINY